MASFIREQRSCEYYKFVKKTPFNTERHTWLHPGEKIELEIKDIIYVKHGLGVSNGYLLCTNYQLRFLPYPEQLGTQEDKYVNHISIPTLSIEKVNKIGIQFMTRKEHGFCLEIECKDTRIIVFSFIPGSSSRGKVSKWIMRGMGAENRDIFALHYNQPQFTLSNRLYSYYDAVSEYCRLGITVQNNLSTPWRFSKANKSYQLCPTYPRVLCVPGSVNDEMLFESSRFRTKGRIPVCCWRHRENGAALCRSSQPLVGVVGNTNNDDEYLIRSIQLASQASHPHAPPLDIANTSLARIDETGPPPLIIFDPRPYVNAVANIVTGAGFESSNVYKNCQIRFLNIPNIHVIRDSYQKFRQYCNSTIKSELHQQSLQATEWFIHITTILHGVIKVSSKLLKGFSALVHCSDGWDRTTQIVSLTEILLDSYYRTIEGFIVLIEKEWLSFGHKFADRCRTSVTKDVKLQERSPIFIQFLECVYQLINIFPSAFEFNEKLLSEIGYHVHSGLYGTFLYNCEYQRRNVQMEKMMPSFWAFVISSRTLYTNENYDPTFLSELILCSEQIINISHWSFHPKPKII